MPRNAQELLEQKKEGRRGLLFPKLWTAITYIQTRMVCELARGDESLKHSKTLKFEERKIKILINVRIVKSAY